MSAILKVISCTIFYGKVKKHASATEKHIVAPFDAKEKNIFAPKKKHISAKEKKHFCAKEKNILAPKKKTF
jgi:hypothetical protein